MRRERDLFYGFLYGSLVLSILILILSIVGRGG